MARERKRPISPASALGHGLTRQARPAAAPDSPEAQARQLEAELGAAEAARRVGVSPRTWRRWKAGGQPAGRNAAALGTEASASARRQAIAPRREKRLRTKGAFVRVAGQIGGDTPGGPRRRNNTRQRTIGAEGTSIHLDGGDMGAILDAWEAGDDEGALEALRDALADEYGFTHLSFENLTMLDFLRDDPNE
jgi:hypothetical protein